MRKLQLIFFVLIAALTACGGASKAAKEPGSGIPQPNIPARSVSLTDFGAVPDGVTLNTEAFAKAIAHLSQQGGGRLDVPAGIWFTGPIGLESNIELHLDDAAIIVFSTDQDLYPIVNTNFEGLDVRRCLSPIHAEGAHDIAITGGGVIDGSGDAWREVKKRKVSSDQWKAVTARGGLLSEDGKVWYPDEGYARARATAGSLNKPADYLDENEIKTFLRPVLVSLRECERVLLEGCTFQNSPCWNIHPLWCRDVTVRNITVRNPHWSANGDGIDIDGCENVLLEGSSFDVGDDAICIKSGKDADGRRHARACRDLIIRDCTVYHGHGGVVIGSEMSGGVENVYVSRCRFMGTDVGLRFKSARGRGGKVRNVVCSDIYMKDIVTYGVIFNLYYEGVSATEMKARGTSDIRPVDETTPEFCDLSFSGITCAGAGQAIYINGLPEMPVRGVSFENCRFTATKGVEVNYAEGVAFDKVFINGEEMSRLAPLARHDNNTVISRVESPLGSSVISTGAKRSGEI